METCPKGHPFDAENTYRRPDGSRVCRACRRDAKAETNARKRTNGEGWISRRPRADGLWVARYTVHEPGGRMRRPALYAKTRAEVAVKLREALASRDRGERAATRDTVEVFLATWHEGTRSQLRPQSWDRQGDHVRLHLVPLIGKVPVKKLRPEEIQVAYARLLDRGLAPATVRRAHATLHRALARAVQWRLIGANPADFVDVPRVPRREMAALSSDQTRTLLESAHGDRLEALYVLAVTSGLRLGELLALRWDCLDLEEGRLQVRGSVVRVATRGAAYRHLEVQEPKTARSRRVQANGSTTRAAPRT